MVDFLKRDTSICLEAPLWEIPGNTGIFSTSRPTCVEKRVDHWWQGLRWPVKGICPYCGTIRECMPRGKWRYSKGDWVGLDFAEMRIARWEIGTKGWGGGK